MSSGRIPGKPSITVCLCTFKRPQMLARLLGLLGLQRTEGLFDLNIVVTDNDVGESARSVVEDFSTRADMPVTYCVEPEQNIALARNRTVSAAAGELLAFIDDDELPAPDWLATLFQARSLYQADGVLGPVVSRFETAPPKWVEKGKFFDRRRHPSGSTVAWPDARTGNVLMSRDVADAMEGPFRAQFGSGGEDVDFFRRAVTMGRRFVWCDEAAVSEIVPAYRCTRRFLAKRALLRGSNFPKQAGQRARNVLKSLIAVPCYAIALPLLALAGHHFFMAYAMKLLEHASRLLAVAGWPLVTERQT